MANKISQNVGSEPGECKPALQTPTRGRKKYSSEKLLNSNLNACACKGWGETADMAQLPISNTTGSRLHSSADVSGILATLQAKGHGPRRARSELLCRVGMRPSHPPPQQHDPGVWLRPAAPCGPESGQRGGDRTPGQGAALSGAPLGPSLSPEPCSPEPGGGRAGAALPGRGWRGIRGGRAEQPPPAEPSEAPAPPRLPKRRRASCPPGRSPSCSS